MGWFNDQLAIYAKEHNQSMQQAFDDLYNKYYDYHNKIINTKFIKDMAKKVQIPFEVLILERKGDSDNETVEIVKVNEKEVNLVLGANPQAVAQAAAMRLGPEYADRADKIDVLVRPFVKG